ncbi:unnamed protein product [marine sediment metagenome]|uniref:Uncharacterized protein n=1 Tax=marine sediment metagenome TaxID=412755 RepID=X1NHJ6_9ZZZZ
MKIDDLIQYGLGGEVKPNLTQDHVESRYGPSFSRLGPGKGYHGRSGAKSNPHHEGTRIRIGNRRARLTKPRNTLDIQV